MTDGPGWTPPEQGSGPGPGSWEAQPGQAQPGQAQSGGAQPWGAPPPGQGMPSWPPPGYGGYGAPWPPPAPKPGVIPLRPVGLGELLDGSIAIIRRNPKATLGFTAVIVTISTAVSTLFAAGELPSLQQLSQRTRAGQPLRTADVRPVLGWLVTGGVVSLLLALAVSVVLTGILTAVVGRAVLGHNITAGQAWRQVRGRIGALLGLSLLIAAIFIVLWAVLAGIVVLAVLAISGAGS